jgi:hypothetical protein
LVDIGVNGRKTLKWALTLEAMSVDWIHLARTKDRWWDEANMAEKASGSKNRGFLDCPRE